MARSSLTSNQIAALNSIVESGTVPGYLRSRTLDSLVSRGLVLKEQVKVQDPFMQQGGASSAGDHPSTLPLPGGLHHWSSGPGSPSPQPGTTCTSPSGSPERRTTRTS